VSERGLLHNLGCNNIPIILDRINWSDHVWGE